MLIMAVKGLSKSGHRSRRRIVVKRIVIVKRCPLPAGKKEHI